MLYNIHWVLSLILVPVVAIILIIAQCSVTVTLMCISIFLIVCSWMVSRFSLQNHLLMLLAVLLPFSVETSVSENLNINIPSEPILVIALFSLGWDLIGNRGLLKYYFGNGNIWIWPLLLCFAITPVFSTMAWVSVKFSIVNITYILVFFLWQKYLFTNQPHFFPKLVTLYSLSFLVILGWGIFQFARFDWNPLTIRGIFRPFYKDHTIFGATSAILATFWFAYSKGMKTTTFRLISLLLGIIFLIAVILSGSRAAVLSLIFAGLLWVVLQLSISVKKIAIGFVFVLLLIGVFHQAVFRFLQENKHLSHETETSYLEKMESSGNISSDISNMERMNRWIAGFGMFAEKPWTGFGPGTYQFKYIPYQKPEFMSRLTVKDPWHIPENSGGTAHSEYILALSEMGIFGILALLFIFVYLIWIAFAKARFHLQREMIIVAFCVLATYLFHALFNNFLNTDKFAFLFWGSAAWIISLFKIQPENKVF